MEELLEKAEEDLEEVERDRHFLTTAMSIHPDADVEVAHRPDLSMKPEERRHYSERKIETYSRKLRSSLAVAQGNLNRFRRNRRTVDNSHYEELKSRYGELEKQAIELDKEVRSNCETAIFLESEYGNHATK